MKYAGMPMGMWVLFAGSFQKQLTAYDLSFVVVVLQNFYIDYPDKRRSLKSTFIRVSRVIYRLVVNTNCFTMTYACITSNGVSVWNSILRAIEGLNIRARIFRR